MFQSGKEKTTAAGELASTGGIAQVRLVPAIEPELPTTGRLGDLYAHVAREQRGRGTGVTLYLCVAESPTQWQQVLLDPPLRPGGSVAP